MPLEPKHNQHAMASSWSNFRDYSPDVKSIPRLITLVINWAHGLTRDYDPLRNI